MFRRRYSAGSCLFAEYTISAVFTNLCSLYTQLVPATKNTRVLNDAQQMRRKQKQLIIRRVDGRTHIKTAAVILLFARAERLLPGNKVTVCTAECIAAKRTE